jgi:hypothetical protein
MLARGNMDCFASLSEGSIERLNAQFNLRNIQRGATFWPRRECRDQIRIGTSPVTAIFRLPAVTRAEIVNNFSEGCRRFCHFPLERKFSASGQPK